MKIKIFAFSMLILLFTGDELMAQIDSLIMSTGETLVGEVKELRQGVVTIETDYSDSDFKVIMSCRRLLGGNYKIGRLNESRL